MTSGVPKTKEALARRVAGQIASGQTRQRAPKPGTQQAIPEAAPLAYLDSLERIRNAEARIKEARARKDEIANAKEAGELISAALASDWSAKLIAAVLIESEGLAAHIDLMGLPPEIAAPLRAAALDLARRFRNRIAALPQLVDPPRPGTKT